MNQSKIYLPTTVKQSFAKRLWIYQNERFPLFKHLLLIATFTFSAIGYARICRGAEGFVPMIDYASGVFMTFTLFLLLRISDEFKDKEEDAKFRSYLPVPRGLISLTELRNVAMITLGLQVLIIGFLQPALWKLFIIVLVYLSLMRVEFFVPNWLKKQPVLYIVSHMMIIPLIDYFASGIDWLNNGSAAPKGLIFFFIVSFLNGIVLEIGRKIKAPQSEEPGVQSYTSLYGTKTATVYWIIVLGLTAITSVIAARYAGFSLIMQALFPFVMILASIPAFQFLKRPNDKSAKWIENASGIWTLSMYLLLGGLPTLVSLLGR